MKSISRMFKENEELLENKSVQDLIKYCEELEDTTLDLKRPKDDSLKIDLLELIFEIKSSIEEHFKEDRFREKPRDDEQALKNLQKYINNFIFDKKLKQ